MAYNFNGSTRRITLDPGTVQLDLIDLYSRWLDWARDNPNFLQAFRVSGGDPDGTGGFTGRYLFLMNGWTIVPQSANHTLNAIGNLYRDPDDTSGNPLVSPVSGYTVNVIFNRSAQAQGISISGTTLTPAQIWNHPDRQLSADGISGIWSFVLAAGDVVGSAGRHLRRLAVVHGLTSANVTASETRRTAGDVDQPISTSGSNRTMTGAP